MSQNKGLSRQWFEKIASPEAIAEFDSGRLTIAVTPRCEHDWSGPEIKFPNGASVSCSKCGANVYHGTADKEANSAAVVVAWNRRASLPQPAAGSTGEAPCLDLGAIEARASAATNGPWEHVPTAIIDGEGFILMANNAVRDEDYDFIAHARTDIPDLIAEVRALRSSSVSEHELLKKLAKELDHRAPAAKSREAREAIQSIKHGIEDVLSVSASTPAQSPAHDEGHPHLIGGEFQSDKYPTTPRGKVPLSVKDKTAQDLLWTYAQRRRVVDGEFANDLELALTKHGFVPSTPALCEDEGCPHYGTAHVCVSTPAQSVLMEALHKISNPFDHGHCGTCGKECAGATDCDCSFRVWEQDDPVAIAKAALSHAP